MEDIIEKLIEFGMKYNVLPSIDFKPEPGCMWIKIRFKRKDKVISRIFFYVPVGEGTIDNFRRYNEFFEEEIRVMIENMEEGDAEC